MHVIKAIRVLTRRREHLKSKVNQDDYVLAEIAALNTAILCMELTYSYGFVAITEIAGPLLKSQVPGLPEVWTSADIREMKKAISKHSKIPH